MMSGFYLFVCSSHDVACKFLSLLVCLFVYLLACLFVCLFACLFVCLFICLFILFVSVRHLLTMKGGNCVKIKKSDFLFNVTRPPIPNPLVVPIHKNRFKKKKSFLSNSLEINAKYDTGYFYAQLEISTLWRHLNKKPQITKAPKNIRAFSTKLRLYYSFMMLL